MSPLLSKNSDSGLNVSATCSPMDPHSTFCVVRFFFFAGGGCAGSCFEAQMSGAQPSARACHTLTRLAHKLFMFGGYDGARCFNDMDIIDLQTMTWMQPALQGLTFVSETHRQFFLFIFRTPPTPFFRFPSTLRLARVSSCNCFDQLVFECEALTHEPLSFFGACMNPPEKHASKCREPSEANGRRFGGKVW